MMEYSLGVFHHVVFYFYYPVKLDTLF